ncbi:MAG TPA: aldehyde ferredoxin oxidoreductase C-terminal domain-containing protein [Candidatus Thermoplasmatota archaeon]
MLAPPEERGAPSPAAGPAGGARGRVARLLGRLGNAAHYPTQGCVLFVDLERRETHRAFLPPEVLRTFLSGRGANMWLLYNLLDESLDALDPDVPLIFGTGAMTGLVPSAARGNVTGRSPDSRAIMDSNCGDYFPSYMKLHGVDHIVLYGHAGGLTMLVIEDAQVEFKDASPYAGMDNLDFTAAVERDFAVKEGRNMAMARITSAGEHLVLCAGIMGGPKAIWARGGTGAKMGSLNLKAILIRGVREAPPGAAEYKRYNREIAKITLRTSVVKNALKTTGTPFLYRPSRVLGAMGTKNNQETTWTDLLDADNIDPYRPGMSGCFKCPVNCRPLNDLTPGGGGGWGAGAQVGLAGNASYDPSQAGLAHDRLRKSWKGRHGDGAFDRYDKGDGPEYVTLGKFGPMIGVDRVEWVIRLNNICNDLGLDTSSTGSAIAWAMELFERGIITAKDTGGLELTWGNGPVVERLLPMVARREGFGAAIADSSRAVERGHYPEEALRYRMAVKGLFQSDPHDARILKAFSLGLAVATRGMDHLRNRVTLEINARINDDPAFKRDLYGGEVSPEPQGYGGKEVAVRRCENMYAVGDSVGMCRFTTKLFNSPTLSGYPEFAAQLANITGHAFDEAALDEVGRNITGLERMLNWRLGLRGGDDTLPDRWFDEGVTAGPFTGERVDRASFERMKQAFYAVTGLNAEGLPREAWHEQLSRAVTGFAVRVRLPHGFPGAPEHVVVVDRPVETVAQLREAVAERLPEAREALADDTLNAVVNGQMVLHGEATRPVADGDEVSFLRAMTGG